MDIQGLPLAAQRIGELTPRLDFTRRARAISLFFWRM